MAGEQHDTAGIVAEPQWIFAASVVAGLLLQWIHPLPVLPSGAGLPIGIALAVVGITLCRSAVAAFRQVGTSIQPGDPASAIVTTGPYRFSRNPIYLGMALLAAGIGLLANAGWVLALLALALVVIQKGVIEREEAYLGRRFPNAYPAYTQHVRRWF